MKVIDSSIRKVDRQPMPAKSRSNRQGKRLWGCLYFLFFTTFLISGCSGTREIRVNNVTPDQDVPTHLLVEYVEQMRYLAIRAADIEKEQKLKKLDDIDQKIEEAKAMLEEYRKQYGFRE